MQANSTILEVDEGNIYTDGSVGCVREEDWAALVAAGDATTTIPLFEQDGTTYGASIALGDPVLGPDGLTTGPAETPGQ